MADPVDEAGFLHLALLSLSHGFSAVSKHGAFGVLGWEAWVEA